MMFCVIKQEIFRMHKGRNMLVHIFLMIFFFLSHIIHYKMMAHVGCVNPATFTVALVLSETGFKIMIFLEICAQIINNEVFEANSGILRIFFRQCYLLLNCRVRSFSDELIK